MSFKKYGKVQVPFLIDPNTGVECSNRPILAIWTIPMVKRGRCYPGRFSARFGVRQFVRAVRPLYARHADNIFVDRHPHPAASPESGPDRSEWIDSI